MHSFITDGAIDRLPSPLRGYFESNCSYVVATSGWEPAGKHYIDIDVYPEFHADEFPRNVDGLVAIYGAAHVNGYRRGPWTAADDVDSLALKMARAESPSDWSALRYTAAALAHYIEDLHNPLHLTVNYDGQLTGNHGIQARYEGAMIEPRFDEIVFSPAAAEYRLSPIDFIFDGVDLHYPYVAEILAADDLASSAPPGTYCDALWDQTSGFTLQPLQEASEAVADMWLTAWVDAGSPRTFTPYAADFDGMLSVDDADLAVWRSAFGIHDSADAARDGVCDGGDFLAWQRNRQTADVGADAAPEPSAAILAVAALAGLPTIRPRCGRRPGRC